MSEKDSEETERDQLIFRLGYNMGVVWRYRNLLREFYSHTMNLRHDRNLSDNQLEDIIKTLDKTATALLDEDKQLTSEKLTEWTDKK